MKKFKSVTLLCVAMLSIGCTKLSKENSNHSEQELEPQKKYKIVSYLPAWKEWKSSDISVEKMTHVNLSFADIQNGVLVDGKDIKKRHFIGLKELKIKNPRLKVLIAVGGWGGDGFSDAALTDSSRKKFAKSAVEYIRRNSLDGLDMDWEYPTNGGWGAIKSRPEDKQNFTLIMKELREQFDRAGKEDKKHYLLTFAANVSAWYLKLIEMEKVKTSVDFVNLMTYDAFGPWAKKTGHHSGLFASKVEETDAGGMSLGVQRYLDVGVPAKKLVFGTAFYGYMWEKVNDKNNGLFQESAGECKDLSYSEIEKHYLNKNGYQRFWDEDAKAAYLWNESKKSFITYDDPEALKYEVEFIKTKDLGGGMIWEYTHDEQEKLLSVLHEGLQ